MTFSMQLWPFCFAPFCRLFLPHLLLIALLLRSRSYSWQTRPSSFNATTAFPLQLPPQLPHLSRCGFQCHHGVPASRPPSSWARSSTPVSMPPRRSCFTRRPWRPSWPIWRFNATTAFLLSWWWSSILVNVFAVSMPPRRSCLRTSWRRTTSPGWFQCHHGVPASRHADGHRPDGARVSMPPRRSCFSWEEVLAAAEKKSFNATTAFLLLYSSPGEWSRIMVSMPPRRSCFTCSSERDSFSGSCFNATTAFLLRLPRLSFPPLPPWFQCHHGVPASKWIVFAF